MIKRREKNDTIFKTKIRTKQDPMFSHKAYAYSRMQEDRTWLFL
jgi:hypothetical protein